MRVILSVCALVLLLKRSEAAECLNSLACEANSCCRNEHGSVLSSEQFGPFGPQLIGGTAKGTCTPGLAQKGELCDGHCKCGAGLECYRPMSGMCCPPHLCYDADWVKKQREYWATCAQNPKCFFPAK